MNVQPGWILGAGIILALIFTVAGAIVAGLAALRFKRRLQALKKAPLASYAPEAQAYLHRINADLEETKLLLENAKGALGRINESLRVLRMPEAILALRTAGAAIRLLLARS